MVAAEGRMSYIMQKGRGHCPGGGICAGEEYVRVTIKAWIGVYTHKHQQDGRREGGTDEVK